MNTKEEKEREMGGAGRGNWCLNAGEHAGKVAGGLGLSY